MVVVVVVVVLVGSGWQLPYQVGEWQVWRGGLVNLDLASDWPVRCLIKLTGEWWFYQLDWRYVSVVGRGVHLGVS